MTLCTIKIRARPLAIKKEKKSKSKEKINRR
jgi:hypothetical protein